MGISKDGNPCYPSRFNQKKNVYWSDVVKKSDRIINFLDLCGHEKYLKTTIYGIMSMINFKNRLKSRFFYGNSGLKYGNIRYDKRAYLIDLSFKYT